MSKNREKVQDTPLQTMISVLTGAVCALVICALLLLAASVGISVGVWGEDGVYRLTLSACLVGNLAGGIIAQIRVRGIWVAVGASAVFCLLLLTVGVCALNARPFEPSGLGLMAAALLGGVLAGLLRRGKRRSASHRRRR